MRILTGDECGLLKEFVPKIAQQQREKTASSKKKSDIILPVHYDRMQNINNQYGIRRIETQQQQTRVKGVVDMTVIGSGENDNCLQFATLRADGSVELWKSSGTSQYERITTASDSDSMEEIDMDIFESVKYNNNPIPTVPVKPLAIEALANASTNKLVACDTHGNLVVLKSGGNKISVMENFCACQNNPDNTTLTYTKGKVMNQQLATCMAVMPESNSRVAIGGRERDVRLVDLQSGGKCLWKAKNLPPDPQTLLQQPIWVSTMTFLTHSNQNLLAVGTGLGQVRIYDVRDSSTTRRPVMYTPSSKEGHRITALAEISDNQIVTGDTTGDLHSMDLRYHFINNLTKTGTSPQQYCHPSSTGRYIGPAGSIQQLIKHPTQPVLACVGYDRILRTYNTQTHKVIDCVYLKQRLNCALLIPDEDDEEEDEEEQVAGTINEEDIADQEDVVEDYIDSDDDEDTDENDDDQKNNEKKMKSTSAAAAAIVEHSFSDDDDDSDDNEEEEEEEEQSGDFNNSSSEASDDDDEEEEEEQQEEAPNRKRRKR